MEEQFIQVGYTEMRDPATGDYLPAVPLYIKADESAKAAEEKLIRDLGVLFARRIKAYKEGCKAAGVTV